MGHYASEMGVSPGYNVKASNEAYSYRDSLNEFWGQHGGSCPICGSTVNWGFLDATNALLHMKFHGVKPKKDRDY